MYTILKKNFWIVFCFIVHGYAIAQFNPAEKPVHPLKERRNYFLRHSEILQGQSAANLQHSWEKILKTNSLQKKCRKWHQAVPLLPINKISSKRVAGDLPETSLKNTKKAKKDGQFNFKNSFAHEKSVNKTSEVSYNIEELRQKNFNLANEIVEELLNKQ